MGLAQIKGARDNKLARRLNEFNRRLQARKAQGISDTEARHGLLEEVKKAQQVQQKLRRTKIKAGKW